MLKLAKPIPLARWAIPVPKDFPKIHEGSSLEETQKALAQLGFQALPDVTLHDTSPPNKIVGWFHPAGVVMAATVFSAGQVKSFRMAAMLNQGFYPMIPDRDDRLGLTTFDRLSGEEFAYGATRLDPSLPKGHRLNVGHALEDLQRRGRLAGFDEWAYETKTDMARGWSFVLGDEPLGAVDAEVGLANWLADAPEALRFFVQQRHEKRQQGTVPEKTLESEARLRQRLNINHLRELGRHASTDRDRFPSPAHGARAAEWVQQATVPFIRSRPAFEPCYDVLPSGYSQAAALALSLDEPNNGARLLEWLEQAPAAALARVVLASDRAGEALPGLLVRMLVNQTNSLPANSTMVTAPVTPVVLQAFETIAARVGVTALQQRLDSEDGPLGLVLRSLPSMGGVKPQACQGVVAFVNALDRLGLSQNWSPAGPSTRATLGQDMEPGMRAPGESWSQAFERALGNRTFLADELRPVLNRIREQELDLVLPMASDDTRGQRPRF